MIIIAKTDKTYSSKYVPSMGMFGSQAGNIMFPTWEHWVPLMGMVFEIEQEPANT